MDDLESRLVRLMNDTAATITTETEESAMARFNKTAASQPRRRAWLAGSAVAAIAAGLAAIGISLAQDDPEPAGTTTAAVDVTNAPATQPRNGVGGQTRPGKPCLGAKVEPAADVAARSEAAGARVFMPADGTRDVTKAWTCGDDTAPFFMIDNVQLVFETGWNVEPESYLKEYVAEWGGQVKTIQGYPARVSPASETQALHSIMIFVDGTVIKLYANPDVQFDRLEGLADKLELPVK